mmetsp:Transcript_11648/g.43787  ORF Transcript_11648/g.43787 Transcript_11648/m.43787 type:complete len:209 (-) Transcript_11648:1934-2560(-)
MSLYRELDIPPHSSKDEIRKAYYKLVTIYHPDRNPDGHERFLKITEAYKILSNQRERSLYDKTIRGTTPSLVNNAHMYDAKEYDFIRFTDKNPEVDLRRLSIYRFKKARYRFYKRLLIGIALVAALHASYSVYSQNSLKKIEDAYHNNVAKRHQVLEGGFGAAHSGESAAASAVDLKERKRLLRIYEENQQQRLRNLKSKYGGKNDSL